MVFIYLHMYVFFYILQMRQAGNVVHAEVMCEHNGRSKGCGVVEYATQEEAKKAIDTLTHTTLMGRSIFVREDRDSTTGPPPPPSTTTSNSLSPSIHTGDGETTTTTTTTGTTSHHNHHHRHGRPSNTSVYVWNMTFETTWQELKDHMRKAGNVDQATILTSNQGTSLGCAVVEYQRPQDAARAIRELYGSNLNGREIQIRQDNKPSSFAGRAGGGRGRGGGRYGGGGSRGGWGGRGGSSGYTPPPEGTQLFVGNLSFETTWQDLKDYFKQCGDVDRANVSTGPGGRSKGFGTVRFFNKEDAASAIETLNGTELGGRSLEIRFDQKV